MSGGKDNKTHKPKQIYMLEEYILQDLLDQLQVPEIDPKELAQIKQELNKK